MGRQIINTEGAAQTIARRRVVVILVLVAIVLAVAAAAYFMRAGAVQVPAAAPTTGARAPAPART